MKLKLGFDMDDVLFDCGTALCLYTNEHYGTSLTKEDIKTYSLQEVWNCSNEEALKRTHSFLFSEEHKQALPMNGAPELVFLLQEYFEVHVITSRSEDGREETLSWLDVYFHGLLDSVHFTNHWHEERSRSKADVCKQLGIDIFVEDAPMHIEDLSGNVDRLFLFDAPWNQSLDEKLFTNTERVFTCSQIAKILTSERFRRSL